MRDPPCCRRTQIRRALLLSVRCEASGAGRVELLLVVLEAFAGSAKANRVAAARPVARSKRILVMACPSILLRSRGCGAHPHFQPVHQACQLVRSCDFKGLAESLY